MAGDVYVRGIRSPAPANVVAGNPGKARRAGAVWIKQPNPYAFAPVVDSAIAQPNYPSIVQSGITANTVLSVQLPADGVILAVFVHDVTNAVTISLGRSNGAADIMQAIPIPANGTITALPGIGILANWFSATLAQTIWVNSPSWGAASVSISIQYFVPPASPSTPQASFLSIFQTGINTNTGLSTALPANDAILAIFIRETTGTQPVTIMVGTSAGADDVMSPVVVPPNGSITALPGIGIVNNWLSATVQTTLYVSSSGWGTAIVNVSVQYITGV